MVEPSEEVIDCAAELQTGLEMYQRLTSEQRAIVDRALLLAEVDFNGIVRLAPQVVAPEGGQIFVGGPGNNRYASLFENISGLQYGAILSDDGYF